MALPSSLGGMITQQQSFNSAAFQGLTVSQALTRPIQPQQQQLVQQQQQQRQQQQIQQQQQQQVQQQPQFSLTGPRAIQPQPQAQATMQLPLPVSSAHAQMNPVAQMQPAFQNQFQQSSVNRQQQQQHNQRLLAAAKLKQQQQQIKQQQQQQQHQQQQQQNRASTELIMRHLHRQLSAGPDISMASAQFTQTADLTLQRQISAPPDVGHQRQDIAQFTRQLSTTAPQDLTQQAQQQQYTGNPQYQTPQF